MDVQTRADLIAWGWTDQLAAAFADRVAVLSSTSDSLAPARVVAQERDRWEITTGATTHVARLTRSAPAGIMPVTGDWVVIAPGPLPADPPSIVTVLPRHTAMSRGAAGDGDREQVLAANLDVVLIVHGLDAPLNARRLERYLTAAWESGATPEIVLTKADLAADALEAQRSIGMIAPGIPVHLVSVHDAGQLASFRAGLRSGGTYGVLGPSGAGKSSLINALAGEPLLETGAVREHDRKGRHTTTRRELFQIPGGALLMDTPGLRELRLWSAAHGLVMTFPEVEAIASQCHFRDCRHTTEPGCAVRAAEESGLLDRDRLASYRKLVAEAAYLERREDREAQAAVVAQHKTALKTMKYHHKRRG